MPFSNRNITILFTLVVTFCLVLVGWWVFFLLRESSYLNEASRLIAAGHTDDALRVLGADESGSFADKAERLRLMFTSEGIFMGLLVLCGVVLLYRTVLRESRLRRDQEHFLTGATHRLKTPLATVRLGLESLLAGSMPQEKKQAYLEAMVQQVDNLEKDLTNLLTAGGLEASGPGMSMTFVAGDLGKDLEEASLAMRDRFAAAGVTLETKIGTPARIKRDPEAIHHILHNLLDNAVKYSNRGDRVTVELQTNDRDVLLTVADKGSGIAPEDLPRIFDRFYRGTDKSHLGGSGIGLYLVRELVRLHGGTVEVQSEGKDKGSRFCIRLPLEKEDS